MVIKCSCALSPLLKKFSPQKREKSPRKFIQFSFLCCFHVTTRREEKSFSIFIVQQLNRKNEISSILPLAYARQMYTSLLFVLRDGRKLEENENVLKEKFFFHFSRLSTRVSISIVIWYLFGTGERTRKLI